MIRPLEKLPIGRTENDPDKLRSVYEIGRQVAEHRIEEIKAFFFEIEELTGSLRSCTHPKGSLRRHTKL